MSHKDLGQTWFERGRWDLAEKDLRLALAEDPNDSQVLVWLGHSLLELGRTEEATELAKKVVGLDPEWVDTHLLLAWCHLDAEEGKPALRIAREAIRLDPENPHTHHVLAAALTRLQQYEKAIGVVETSLELDPEFEAASHLRTRLLILLERREADAAVEANLRHDPEDPEVHSTLGWKELYDGEDQKALVHFREALRLDPTSDEARTGLILCLKSRNLLLRLLLGVCFVLSLQSFRVVLLFVIGCAIAYEFETRIPSLEQVLTPFSILLLGVYLFAWVAEPLSNVLLLANREGRNVLDRVEVRQGGWLVGWLVVIAAMLAAWLTLDAVHGSAPAITALLLVPVVIVSGMEGEKAKGLLVAAIALFALGIFYGIGKGGESAFALLLFGTFAFTWMVRPPD